MAAAPLHTPAQARDSLRTRGFAVIPDVFSAVECQRVAGIAMNIAAREMSATPDEAFTVDRDDHGRIAPRKIDYPFLKDARFRDFILDQRLQQLVAHALGRPGYLMRDQLFCKPPRFGTAKPYHQENASLFYQPADEMIVTWIALDDASEANGCLHVLVSFPPEDGHLT
jgi:ectoine hydroxylase-related dioxygenase (phytanoyl-CoA dioxygenase family)